VVRNPVFPKSEIEREKKRLLDLLSQESNDPSSIAARVRSMLAFGHDHPYGRPTRGLPSSVEKISREDIVKFYKTYWKPGGSVLIFVGDITLSEAKKLAEKNFGSWSGGKPPDVKIPPPSPVGQGKIFMIDRQGAAQTVISLILPAPERRTKDYYPLVLANAVWGGGFMTRLNLNLREEKGYSYGVFSNLILYSKAGTWIARGGVQTDKTKESVIEFVKELKYIAGEKPITDEELENAKVNRIRGYAQQFESLSSVALQVAGLWAYELPMSELKRMTVELEKVKLEDVNRVARKYAVPDKAIILLVGDLSKIKAGIEELNLGEIVILDVEGNPVSLSE
jgi:zinc protease